MKAASSLVRKEIVPIRYSGTSGRLIAWSAATATNSSSIPAKPRRGLRASVPGVRALAGDIMRKAGNHRAECTRGHVDHAAPFSRPHAGHERGSDQEGAVEIDG